MILKNLFNLQLFADGDGQAAAESTSEAVSVDSGENTASLAAAENDVETQKPTFDEMIKGEYKQDFDNRVQKIINQRFKDHKPLADYKKNSERLMTFLGERFGKTADDFDGILNAMRYDESYIENQAMKEGTSSEEMKQRLKFQYEKDDLARENAELKRLLDEKNNAETEARNIEAFNEDARKTKEVYNNFELATEMQNEEFVSYVRKGIPLRKAYELTHLDELLSNAMHYTAQKVSEQVTNNIKARGARPTENGVSSQTASSVKVDVSKLTSKELADIRRRVAAGEEISF